MLIAGFGRRGHAVGDIPGVRFKVVKVAGWGLGCTVPREEGEAWIMSRQGCSMTGGWRLDPTCWKDAQRHAFDMRGRFHTAHQAIPQRHTMPCRCRMCASLHVAVPRLVLLCCFLDFPHVSLLACSSVNCAQVSSCLRFLETHQDRFGRSLRCSSYCSKCRSKNNSRTC